MKLFHSFSELAQNLRIGSSKKKFAKEKDQVRKCRVCGSIMKRIDNTNIYVCENERCNNFALKRR